ncbi:MAG: cation diffusion facilitator family transporter [Candidatus Dormibacteraeota bacterium]|nr:cation diffusion facilitator family transporter [Candidatus Dormibacteraeota bacterium]MBO0746384.1 cation diffusion facilitator family transporter [Candidatus Dormibacteraeota bacterium]
MLRRGDHRRSVAELVALGSLIVDCLLVAGKLTAALLTGSLGLLSDAVQSGLDLIASSFAFLAVRAATKPADYEHPYGHARAENLAAFGEGLLLGVAALVIGYEGVRRVIGGGVTVQPSWFAYAVLGITIAVEATRTTVLRRVAHASGSPALAASAQNRFADILSALAVLIGLILVQVAGLGRADAVAALIVSVIILRTGALLAWRSGDILMDRAPRGVEEQVRGLVAAVDGVREVREVRVRRSGSRLLGDARVSARRLLSVERAETLVQEIQEAVRRGLPQLDLTVVVEAQPRSSAMVERVHAVAQRQPQVKDLHNVTVEQEGDGSLHLSMHAKLPGDLSLAAATEASAALEESLRKEFPDVARVDVHLEPLEPDLVRGSNVTGSRADLAEAVRQAVARHPELGRWRDVELSDRAGRITAYVVGQLPADVPLERAHAVETEIEEQVRREVPGLVDVVARIVPDEG